MLSELVLCSISVCMYEDVARAAFWQLVEKQIFCALHGKFICALDLFTSWYFMSLTSHRMAAPPLHTPLQWLCVTSAFYLQLLELIPWSCPSHTFQTVVQFLSIITESGVWWGPGITKGGRPMSAMSGAWGGWRQLCGVLWHPHYQCTCHW